MEINVGKEGQAKKRFGIFGVPWDGGASLGRPGSRYAPAKVREALCWIGNRIQDQKIAAVEKQAVIDFEDVCVRDFGDVDVFCSDFQKTFNRIARKASGMLDRGFIPLVIGGDHSITFPLIEEIHRRCEGNIGLIQLDAHLDLLEESARQGKFSHSSEIRRALELERVHAKNLVQIGVRGFNYPKNLEFVRAEKITQFTPQHVRDAAVADIADRALEIAGRGTERIYLTVDIDVIDPAYAPGCGANEPGGLTVAEVEALVDRFAPHVACFDVVEVNPLFDVNDVTASVAAKLLFDFIVSCAMAGK
jgi:agmatinase